MRRAFQIIAAIFVLFFGVIEFSMNPFFGAFFSRAGWAEAGSCKGLTDWKCVEKQQVCGRGPMVWMLQKFHLSPGSTQRHEVTEMLGDEWTPYRRSESQGSVSVSGKPACLQWTLGMCSGLGMDYDSFVVCFDNNDKVEKSFHYQS
jgi:hypothetical protein